MDELIGTRVGRYDLIERIGGSDISTVFKAYDTRLERHVALKLVVRSKEYSSDFADYFLREAQALAQLSHPNIVKILDFGQDQGYLFLVMELIQGEPLIKRLAAPMDWRDAAEILLPVADALEYAHKHGTVHRDLKPSNILISEDGHPMLSDFAVARIIEEEETRDVTGTTVGLGSPFYMSPEQGKGLPVDNRADIYAIGVIFFEMVTGQKPFNADNGMEVVIQQVSAQPPSPRKFVPDLPEPVERVILSALKKDREERIQSMSELAAAIKQIRQSGRYQPRPRQKKRSAGARIAMAAGALLFAVLIVGAAWYSSIIPGFRRIPLVSESPTGDVAPKTAVADVRVTATPTSPHSTPTARPPTRTPVIPPTATLPAIVYPAFPVIEGSGLPDLRGEAIQPENVNRMIELARYGVPHVETAVWTRDGQYLVAGTSGGVYLYEVASLRPALFLDARGWISAVALDFENELLATGDRSGMVRLWDFKTGEQLYGLPGHTKPVTSLAFSSDATLLISGSEDNTGRIWDVGKGYELFTLKKHSGPVRAVAFLGSTHHAITGGEDFLLTEWNADSGEIVKEMTSQQAVQDIAITASGRTMAAGLRDTLLELWDMDAKSRTKSIRNPELAKAITSVSFSPNGQLLATGSQDGIVRVRNVQNGEVLGKEMEASDTKVATKDLDPVIKVGFSRGGKHLFSLTHGGRLIIWEMDTRKELARRDLPYQEIKRAAVSPDQSKLVFQMGQNLVLTWSLTNGNKALEIAGTLPRGSVIAPNSEQFIVQNGETASLYKVDGISSQADATLAGFPLVGTVSFLPDNKILAASTVNGIQLWATASGRQLSPENYQRPPGSRCQVAYSGSGQFLAGGSGTGVFLNEQTMPFYCKINRNPRTQKEAFVQDKTVLVMGLDNSMIELWSPEMGMYPAGKGRTSAVAVSPDGRLLVTGGDEGIVRLWDIEKKMILLELDHHNAAVTDAVFSTDGSLLITSSADGMVEIWGLQP